MEGEPDDMVASAASVVKRLQARDLRLIFVPVQTCASGRVPFSLWVTQMVVILV